MKRGYEMSDVSPMIQIRDMKFSYPDSDSGAAARDAGSTGRGFRLDIEAVSIGRGEKVAVIGPSGIGKTTLLNLIAGIFVPNAGEIMVDGTAVSSLDDGDRRAYRITEVGFVFQDFRLIEYLSVLDNILLPFRINRALSMTSSVREQARTVAADLGILGKLAKYPAKLSHGERQRVAICRAVITEPKILLADEPTGNLDPANKAHILDLLFAYVDRTGASLIMVTHDHALLDGFGRVIDFGKPDTFTT